MQKKRAFLFDLDGVIIDSEPQYDVFWRSIGLKYSLEIANFERIIKGTTLPNILAKYFSHLPEAEQMKIVEANKEFDLQMDIQPIAGAMEFLGKSKKEGIPMGLVTSSSNLKLDYVFSQLPIRQYFDTVVSSDRIKEGKPHPMCYLLAASDLNIVPEQCVVFEDSFNGIKSGNAAGMRVIGLATTHPKESLESECARVISSFENHTPDKI